MCSYFDRDEVLVAYVYDDIDPAARAAFETHLPECAACRSELAALRGVRTQLAHWAPPEPKFVTSGSESRSAAAAPPDARARRSWIPAWAPLAAAAIVVLAVGAAIANVEVRRDAAGWTLRTGWSRPASAAATQNVSAAPVAQPVVTRTDLTVLEQQLRTEWRAQQASHQTPAGDPAATRASADADLLRRVRALIDESEKRQQRELALRVGEVVRDVNAQRQADLVKIDRSLGLVQNNLGIEVLKQRQSLNYLMRVNQRQ
jgi:hypothetical protein